MNNELCSMCGKRRPTVYVSQMDPSGKPGETKKICLACAYKLGLPQIKDFMDKFGISEDNISDDLDGMLGQIEEGGLPDELKDMMNGGAAPGSGEENDTDEDDFDDKDAESKKSATNTPDFDRMMRMPGICFRIWALCSQEDRTPTRLNRTAP